MPARVLMCPPDHFGIEYEINPWMSRERPADRVRAKQQWESLRSRLIGAGAVVETIEPVAGLPDLVFTANAAVIYRNRAIVARFRHEVRQRETPVDAAWFTEHGFAVETLPDGVYLEGAGDALFCGDDLFAGYRIRSDASGCQALGKQLGVRVIPLELVDPYYYHLDTCFCPLKSGQAIYFPPAFDDYAKRALAAHVPDLIPVVEDEARKFACNAVVVGNTVVANDGCPKLAADLTSRGYTVYTTPLDEFVKSGGSAKCLTLRLDGEEAAAWAKAKT